MTAEAKTVQLHDPQPGERRGDITFVSLIQEGMSSNLYLTWHHRYWSPMVCKIIRASERHDELWQQVLFTEGEVLQKVAHPNIVQLFELNKKAPQPYLLLDYLPGATVRQVLKHKGPFSIQDALRLTMYIGGTLIHVHSCGYIHRDIKPSNVMLHDGYVKLFDFGIAWSLDGGKPPNKSGTAMYLAPEQCLQLELSAATDIWALGLFLFELLTGKLPFPESNYEDYEAELEERYSQMICTPMTLKEAGRRVPAGIQQVIDRCLAFDPAERYQTVEECLLALDPFCKTKIWPALPDPDGKAPGLSTFLKTPSVC